MSIKCLLYVLHSLLWYLIKRITIFNKCHNDEIGHNKYKGKLNISYWAFSFPFYLKHDCFRNATFRRRPEMKPTDYYIIFFKLTLEVYYINTIYFVNIF